MFKFIQNLGVALSGNHLSDHSLPLLCGFVRVFGLISQQYQLLLYFIFSSNYCFIRLVLWMNHAMRIFFDASFLKVVKSLSYCFELVDVKSHVNYFLKINFWEFTSHYTSISFKSSTWLRKLYKKKFLTFKKIFFSLILFLPS